MDNNTCPRHDLPTCVLLFLLTCSTAPPKPATRSTSFKHLCGLTPAARTYLRAMITVLQIVLVTLMLMLLLYLVYKPKRTVSSELPANYEELLEDYVSYFANLDATGKKRFTERFRSFLASVRITSANAEVEDLDRVLIGAAAIIPVFHIPDWEYINLREVLLYPGNFNNDYEQEGRNRMYSGMVGNGSMDQLMILNKWELRQGFINRHSHSNTAIHEFVHLIDKMDGTLDGVPELLLLRQYVPRWKALMATEMELIRMNASDVQPYGATSAVECFAVLSEYFFEQPERFRERHPELAELMERIFVRRQPG